MAKLGEYGERLPTMTADEVALVASRHLIEQGVKSLKDGQCAYDGDGVCCAAAPFIKDYDEDMEGEVWYSLVEDYGQSSAHKEIIARIQWIHDVHPLSLWLNEIRAFIDRTVGDFPQTMAYLESVT